MIAFRDRQWLVCRVISHRLVICTEVGTSGDIIGRYERDEVKPSIEVASKIADILEVSLDYLMGKTEFKLDKSNITKVLAIQSLPE